MADPTEDAPEPAAVLGALQELLLGGPPRHTRRQAADQAGVPVAEADRLWNALGFASVAEEQVAFTDSDVTALADAFGLVEAGLIDRGALRTVTRVVGQTMSRLAEWQARQLLELLTRNPGMLAGPAELADFVARIQPVLEQVQLHVWRRQLADSAQRLLGTAGGPGDVVVAGFADLAGYTGLSRELDVDELAGVLEEFETLAFDLVAEHHGQVIKTIGDEVLFTVPDPAAAAELALRLHERSESLPEQSGGAQPAEGLPALRIGLALGPVPARYGDVYGPVVNIASRLTGLARPGTVLIDQQLAEALAGDERWSIRRLRPIAVRGYHHLLASRLRRAG
ncbi:MAG TPA: adenylate/guanylate cyclase domain-containing protein [Jatrophihabitans sp.]|nr:adenylate/guanylate cyclase domain-containing protein [Jatrophihabitans sp.]